MKKILFWALVLFAAAALMHELRGQRGHKKPRGYIGTSGNGYKPMKRYKALVIATSPERVKVLKGSLLREHAGLFDGDVAVRLAGRNDPGAVARHLEWALSQGVSVVLADGDSYEPADPQVLLLMQRLGQRGVKCGVTEFAD